MIYLFALLGIKEIKLSENFVLFSIYHHHYYYYCYCYCYSLVLNASLSVLMKKNHIIILVALVVLRLSTSVHLSQSCDFYTHFFIKNASLFFHFYQASQ